LENDDDFFLDTTEDFDLHALINLTLAERIWKNQQGLFERALTKSGKEYYTGSEIFNAHADNLAMLKTLGAAVPQTYSDEPGAENVQRTPQVRARHL
jgi:hypothetical protein